MRPTPPHATDPATAAFEYEFQFEPTANSPHKRNEYVSIISGPTRRDTLKSQAVEKLRHQRGDAHPEDITTNYRLIRTRISFHDAPWDSFEGLETALGDFDSVRHATYVPQGPRVNVPAQFRLIVADGHTDDDVIADVEAYYPGLQLSSEGGHFYVAVNAIQASKVE